MAKHKCNLLMCSAPCCIFYMRFVLAALLLAVVIISYCHRVNFNMAIVEMVNQPKKTKKNTACPAHGTKPSVIKNIAGGKQDYNEDIQSNLLSSFYVGYIFTNLASGYFCDKYGAKWILIGGMIISTLLTAISPPTWQHLHWGWFYFLRAVLGFFQGPIFPAISTLLAHWIPKVERAKVGGIVFAGNALGIIIGQSVTGLMINVLSDWPTSFYFWAFVAAVWCILAVIYMSSDPKEHKHIDETEKQYLTESIQMKEARKCPLKQILLDKSQWAITFGTFGHTLLLFLCVNNFPKYMNNVLNYDIKTNAVASSFPYLGMYISSVLSGVLADYLTAKKYNVSIIRKIYGGISGIGCATFILLSGYCDCNRFCCLTCISIGLFLKGIYFASIKVGPMDITKNFAGMIMAISNGLGAIAGAAIPKIVAKLAPNNMLNEWHNVYWTSFAISSIFTILYMIFCSANRAKWDYTEEEYAIAKVQMDAEAAEKKARKEAKKLEKEAKKAEKEGRPAAGAQAKKTEE